MKNAREVLSEVRDLFQSTHWTQGHWHQWSEDGMKMKYCLVGGLRSVIGGEPGEEPTTDGEYALYDGLVRRLHAELASSGKIGGVREDEIEDWTTGSIADMLITFNDSAETTLDDVLALLDAAKEKVPA